MAEYIEREELLEKLHEIGGCGAEPDTWADGYDKGIDVAYGLVQRTPAADVAPARHGKWLASFEYDELIHADCSECNGRTFYMHHFCPCCGAKMNGWTEVTSDAAD